MKIENWLNKPKTGKTVNMFNLICFQCMLATHYSLKLKHESNQLSSLYSNQIQLMLLPHAWNMTPWETFLTTLYFSHKFISISAAGCLIANDINYCCSFDTFYFACNWPASILLPISVQLVYIAFILPCLPVVT